MVTDYLARIEEARAKLTDRQAKFADLVCERPLERKGTLYTEAGYRQRGSSADVSACQTLKLPKVQAYLAALRQPDDDKRVLSRQRKRERLADIAEARIDGVRPSDIISAITTDNLMTGENQPVRVEGEFTFRAILEAIAPTTGLPRDTSQALTLDADDDDT